jgi:TPR repeat protein
MPDPRQRHVMVNSHLYDSELRDRNVLRVTSTRHRKQQGETKSSMSDSFAQRMGPEAVLAAIFSQAFSGGVSKLPAGITRADLRAALALAPAAQARIYEQIRASRHPQAAAAARAAKPAGKRSWAALFGAILVMGCLAVASLPRHAPQQPVPAMVQPPAAPTPPAPKPAPVAAAPVQTPPPALEPVALLLSRATHEADALASLQSRAATGEADAAYALATLLDSQRTQDEITLPKDDKAAFTLYEQAARAGNVQAEYATGRAYQTGRGVTPDAALATAWYRAAALSGLAPAQTSLGFAYQTGLGITRDNSSAAFWFSRAAAQSDAAGETALGYLYLYGQGVAQDQPRGVALFSQAAAQNFAPAFLALGFCYAQGLGTAQNLPLATSYFLKADQSGVPQAKAALAMLGPAPAQDQLAAASSARPAGN